MPLSSFFGSPECALDDQGQRPLVSGVARIYTKREDQTADLLYGTMRRISRARSFVSGVELWHPAKPLLENRVEFVHCIVIIMHRLPKLCLQSPCCFLNAPSFIQTPKPGPRIILFCPLSVCEDLV